MIYSIVNRETGVDEQRAPDKRAAGRIVSALNEQVGSKRYEARAYEPPDPDLEIDGAVERLVEAGFEPDDAESRAVQAHLDDAV